MISGIIYTLSGSNFTACFVYTTKVLLFSTILGTVCLSTRIHSFDIVGTELSVPSCSMLFYQVLQHLFSGFPPSPLLVDIQLLVVDFNRTHVTQVITRQFGTSCCGYISNDGRHPVDPIDRKRQHDQH